ncbi:Alpha/Beta hydrolase protein [Rhizoctonia solani]|nr:Alpha/Beta hydrolase protein [Rhizoctonia solani]
MGAFVSRSRRRYTVDTHNMLYSPEAPAYFEVLHKGKRVGPDSTTGNASTARNLSVRALVETSCPSLMQDYKPTWWLPGGHLQTAFCVVADFTKVDEILYERTLLSIPDGGTLGLDFTPRTQDQELPPETPIVVVLHGLSGGSHESYVRSILSQVCASPANGGLGYRAVVVNFRGCAGVPLTSSQFYSAGHTEDIRIALSYIQKTYPRARLTGIGFSLGANVLVRYLGEEGEKSRLDAGCALGCPWNLVDNSKHLEGSFFYRNVYSRAMGGNLLKLLSRHVKTLAKLPPSPLTPHIPRAFSLKNPTLKQVDGHLTIIAGGHSPPFPFPSADEYYEWARSDTHLDTVRVPLLAINAEDDPIVRKLPVEAALESKYVVLAVTPKGGHLGWFEGGTPWRRSRPPPRWIRKPVTEWIEATCEGLTSRREVGDEWVEDESGFTVERERRYIGFKVHSLHETVIGTEDEAQGGLQGL